jgi:DNA-binding transcriptional ArsR family regulator
MAARRRSRGARRLKLEQGAMSGHLARTEAAELVAKAGPALAALQA